MMKLIDKISKYGVAGPEELWPMELQIYIRQKMNEAVCVDINNVAEWYNSQHEHQIPFTRISPMFVLPFDVMWCEYLHIWNADGIVQPDMHLGFLLIRESNPQSTSHGIHVKGVIFSQVDELSNIVAVGQKFFCENHGDELYKVAFEKNEKFCVKVTLPDGTQKDPDDDSLGLELAGFFSPVAAAISFFHCSNVRIVDNYPDKPLSKRFEQKHGMPLRVMKTIDIHKPQDVHGGSSDQQHSESILAAHLVRGHFKRYNNLFGSIAGMWFWRPHVRGVGVPEKRDYKVFAPDKQHHGKCIVEEIVGELPPNSPT